MQLNVLWFIAQMWNKLLVIIENHDYKFSQKMLSAW